MKLFKQAQKYGSRALALVAAAGASTAAMAQEAGDNPLVTMLNAIGLSGTQAAVAALGLVIVGITLTFKGPDVAKRIIRKI